MTGISFENSSVMANYKAIVNKTYQQHLNGNNTYAEENLNKIFQDAAGADGILSQAEFDMVDAFIKEMSLPKENGGAGITLDQLSTSETQTLLNRWVSGAHSGNKISSTEDINRGFDILMKGPVDNSTESLFTYELIVAKLSNSFIYSKDSLKPGQIDIIKTRLSTYIDKIKTPNFFTSNLYASSTRTDVYKFINMVNVQLGLGLDITKLSGN